MKHYAIPILALFITGIVHAETNQPPKITKTEIVEKLVRALEKGEPRVRAEAVLALAEIAGTNQTARLVALLDDEEAVVRRAAVTGLRTLGDHTAVTQLVGEFTDAAKRLSSTNGVIIAPGPSTNTFLNMTWMRLAEKQTSKVRALGELHDPDAVPPLLEFGLKSPDVNVRIVSAVALGKIKDQRACEPLRTILVDYYAAIPAPAPGVIYDVFNLPAAVKEMRIKEAYCRAAICWALGELRCPDSTKIINRAMDDNDSNVRDAATEALEKLSR